MRSTETELQAVCWATVFGMGFKARERSTAKGTETKSKLIDAEPLSLDEWLNLLKAPPPNTIFIDYMFPSDKHKQEYIETITERPYSEIRGILRKFLPQSGQYGADLSRLQFLLHLKRTDPEEFRRQSAFEFQRRLLNWAVHAGKAPPPLEGITWVLDLLPNSPGEALSVIGAYLSAHAGVLPDGRISGLSDAAELVRAKYIGMPGSHGEALDLLMDLSPRHFECIIERLYHAMGYETTLTPASRDRGRDIVAVRHTPGRREHLLIECKRRPKIGAPFVAQLRGIIGQQKANKGAIVTPGVFTKDARQFAESESLIELVPGKELIPMMNEYLGARWPVQIESLVNESLDEYQGKRRTRTRSR